MDDLHRHFLLTPDPLRAPKLIAVRLASRRGEQGIVWITTSDGWHIGVLIRHALETGCIRSHESPFAAVDRDDNDDAGG